jgi:hypothetical protein
MAALALNAGCGRGDKAASTNAAQAQAQPSIPLPADPGERAATCYAAKLVGFDDLKGAIPVEQANEAAHFIFLGASSSGITEPTKVNMLQQVARAAEPAVRQSGRAADYVASCRAAYPATTRAFAGLPADSRDTRLQCYALSFAMNQIYDQSPQLGGERLPRYRKLYAVLENRMSAELNPGGRGNLAEIAGLTTRSLATAIELGPITSVLDACAARYAAAA